MKSSILFYYFLFALFMANPIFSLRYIIGLCLLLIVQNANAQTKESTLNIGATPSYIDSKKIIGIWFWVDSIEQYIEFMDAGYEMKLISNHSHAYYFPKDTIGNMSISGYYPLWPPPGCDLVLISNDTLKITYSPFFEPGPSFFYVKKNRLIKKK